MRNTSLLSAIAIDCTRCKSCMFEVKPAQKDEIACVVLAVAETEAKMSPIQKSENIELYEY